MAMMDTKRWYNAQKVYSTSDLFAAFAHGMQVGKVMLVGPGKARPVTCKPDLTAPLFDFGRVFDIGGPMSNATEFGRQVNERAVDAIKTGDFKLPFPKVWYFYRCRDVYSMATLRMEFVNLVYAEQDDEGDVTVISFQSSSQGKLDEPQWTQTAFRWKLGSHLPQDNVDLEPVCPLTINALPAAMVAGLTIDVAADNTALKSGTMLLNLPTTHYRQTGEHGAAVTRINARRAKNNQPALPRIIVINLDPSPSLPAQTAGRKGFTVSGHERRAHLRRLKNGTVISIDAMKIKGGAATQQVYKVKV